jgi:beta-mannosidase
MRLFVLSIATLNLFCTMAQDTLSWQLFHPVKKEWLDAGTHGSVQEVLIKTGELPDPFVGKNEALFSWVEEYQWEMKSEFIVTDKSLGDGQFYLEFPVIDTYADVYLNDSLILQATNFFKPYTLKVSSKLLSGKNKVRMVFTPPVMFHEKRYKEGAYKLPAPNDVHPIAIAPYCRKPQYQFGWDWALRMNTMGLQQPARLICSFIPPLVTASVQTVTADEQLAQLKLTVVFSEPIADETVWKSKLFGEFKIEKGASMKTVAVSLEQPTRWWPTGYGDPHLYRDEWTFIGPKKEIYTKKITFGIRTSELIQESDQWGTSYVISVNGKRIFCKGGDYIPQDIFPSRVKDSDVRHMVKEMASANFNMVRVWGGGYYPNEVFYETADELGIMVWQDFMFACAMYPGDSSYLKEVSSEFDFQVPRISSHPSVVLFNGNNEVDVAWKNWGFQIRYSLYGKDAKDIEDNYVKLFKELLPKKVTEWSTVPYIHTSPLSNWGKDEFYNHGSQHYWGVWHGKDPMENFAKKIGRFNAEYGFQSFPEMSTIHTFAEQTDFDLNSDVMKHHQKSYVGNGMIQKHAKNMYGEPKNFLEFVYFSQLTQAEAVGIAIAGHRLDAPRCMGTLYWQINDCWPAPTWSSIDYFGQWKALHFRARQEYEDATVLCRKNPQNQPEYVFICQRAKPLNTELTYEIFDLSGKKKHEGNVSLNLQDGEKKTIALPCKWEGVSKDYAVKFSWKEGDGNHHERQFIYAPSFKTATKEFVSFEVQEVDEQNKKAVLLIHNDRLLRNCWIFAEHSKIKLKDNFIDILPGTHRFEFTYSQGFEVDDLKVIWW